MKTSSKNTQGVHNSALVTYNARRLRLRERIRLWLAGRTDAKNGVIVKDDDGSYTSPTLSELRYHAHRSVNTNLSATSVELGKIQAQLDQRDSTYRSLLAKHHAICAQIDSATEAASVPLQGDEGASSGTLARRTAHRVGKATNSLVRQREQIFSELCTVADEAAAMRDAHREVLFLCVERLEITEALYLSQAAHYLRAARAEGADADTIRPLDKDRVNTSLDAFSGRTEQYDFSKHLAVASA